MSRIVNSYETAARLHLVSGSFSHHQPAAGFHVETVHMASLRIPIQSGREIIPLQEEVITVRSALGVLMQAIS